MGRQDLSSNLNPEEFRVFTRALLRDLRALERMLAEERFESGIRRIGAEQELFLVDRGFRPAPVAPQVLENLNNPAFTTELAQFNMEINLPPAELTGRCFSQLEATLGAMIQQTRAAAQPLGADVILTGILPTLMTSDLRMENLTPRERYFALNDVLTRASGGRYQVHIQGTDELRIQHDSVMLEGCNTSFQVHLQVSAAEFARRYNVAQAIAGPVLAAAVNSPLLFGRRLWSETRIPLFQRSLDTRASTPSARDLTPRVRFGEHWVRKSVVELFQEDIARIPALFGMDAPEDPMESLARGEVPELRSLQLYNSTVYKWNRPCYGWGAEAPHLRIECRIFPSGPTIVDEVANAAFWIGLMCGGEDAWGDVTTQLSFDDARANFLAAARRGLKAGFTWFGGRAVSAPDLIIQELIPIARDGLRTAGIAAQDIDRYLGVLEARVTTGCTGAAWLEDSLVAMGRSGTRTERLTALTASMARQQQDGIAAHLWEPAVIQDGGGWRHNYQRVEQFMTTELFTVGADEVVDLAALVMDWKRVRQIPVEDDQHRLVGLVSYGAVLRLLAGCHSSDEACQPVRSIMDPEPLTVSPGTTTLDAIRLMRAHMVTCLPVVAQGTLVGIVTHDDLVPIAERLLEEKMDG